ncbi:response regulator [Desulfuromonas thiophila]|uniref:Two-component system, chemotaxis family, response regulator CheY n=1 Tax=Desulfuromonas thiophila TaxID=57664 RepID=A0A1G7BNU4_9BACT|nr:response regulator [Desulfuromonas thiophila]SDE27815.1 two-component system, chemotaxis family, response regulator CheY [Desulfuromonas thiophila]
MKRIVIADDSGTARMMIRRCLEIIGLQDATFEEAENGREALALVKKTATDLLVSDLNMPIMDGEALLQWVKASPKLVDLPVLIITSAGNPAKSDQLREMGAFAVINKPINPAILSEVLAPLLDNVKG